MNKKLIEALKERLKEDDESYFVKVVKAKPGVNGKDGRDGKDGERGPPGIGLPGPRGKDGQPGKDGRDGKDGINGLNGLNGKDGADGKDGRSVNEIFMKEQKLYVTYSDGETVCIGNMPIVERRILKEQTEIEDFKTELQAFKSYVTNKVNAIAFQGSGGGRLKAQASEIFSNIDTENSITPYTMNEYLWKIKTNTFNGGIQEISFKNGLYQKIILQDDTTVKFSDFPETDYLGRLTLEIINNSNKTITWQDTIFWNFGEAPNISAGNSILVITTSDAGNTIYGNLAGQDYSS